MDKIFMMLGAILTCATLNGMNKEGKRPRAEEKEAAIIADRVVRQAIDAANADARFTEAVVQTLLVPGLSGPEIAHIRQSVTNNFLDAQDARIRARILNP